MSIALESSGGGGGDGPRRYNNIDPPGLITRLPFMATMYGSSDLQIGGGDKLHNSDSPSSSSSIGKNSDLSVDSAQGGDSSADNEVQSSFKGPLDSLNSLEDDLPIKKSMSKFYNGKSKSFTSLADASAYSITDLVKPENAYSKKRKNLLASTVYWGDKKEGNNSKQNGLYKRQASGIRGIGCCESDNSSSSSSSPLGLPPLHPRGAKGSPSTETVQGIPPVRSFSLSDLQSRCASKSATK